MLGRISFIGGIHGVGKSTICADICQQAVLQYLSASELIKWKEINSDSFNKKVVNIPDTQDRLIHGLNPVIQSGINYLLDGHYCLLDSTGKITAVPLETFKAIKLASLHIITGNVAEIKRQLEGRDSKFYDAELLNEMQAKEIEHAKSIASLLGVGLSMGTQSDYSEIVVAINQLHAL